MLHYNDDIVSPRIHLPLTFRPLIIIPRIKEAIKDNITTEISEFVRINDGQNYGLDEEDMILVAARVAVNAWNPTPAHSQYT